MNKNAIQKFAIWARKELITQVSQRAYQYGIDESGFGDASADTLNGRLLTAEENVCYPLRLQKMDKEKALYGKTGGGSAFHWRKCHGGTGLRAEYVGQSRIFPGKNEAAHF